MSSLDRRIRQAEERLGQVSITGTGVEGIQAGEGILSYIERVGIIPVITPVSTNRTPSEYTIMTGLQGAQEMNAALDEIISREFGEYTWKIKSQKRPEETTENKSFLDNIIIDDSI